MSAPDKAAEYDLLTEHFGYPPVSLLDDIINAVNVLADRALGAVETALIGLPAQNIGFGHSKKRSAPGADPSGAGAASSSPEEAAKREIENGTHKLETLLNTNIDKNFDIFELYTMQNILTVKPADQPFMELAHYQGLDFEAAAGGGGGSSTNDAAAAATTTTTAAAPTVESITQLRRRLHASQQLHVALEAERVRNDMLLKNLRAALGVKATTTTITSAAAASSVKKEDNEDGDSMSAGQKQQGNAFGFLRDRGTLEEGGSVRPITTTTEFTLSQLQALRSLSSSLRTLIPQISGGGAEEQDEDEKEEDDDEEGNGEGEEGEDKSWRRERAEYVERATRRYLETVAGVEMGPAGEVRDGEWQGPGRGLSRDEVEGLERVVAVLGASSGGGGGGGAAAKEAPAPSGEGDTQDDEGNEMDES